MAKRTSKTSALDEIMNEAIRLPGCPGIIVTRGWAWHWLKRMGHDPKTRGFGSIDYMVFGGSRMTPVNEPLTDLTDPAVVRFLAAVEADIQRAA